MRLESALNAAREGITVHGQAISVIGDNIANSSTTGFKNSRTEFEDMLSEGADGLQSQNIQFGGSGVELSKVRTLIRQGGVVEPTGRSLDMAIDGSGFFVTGTPENQVYTRNGTFNLDNAGNLISATGQKVLGYAPGSTALTDLNLYQLTGAGAATSQAQLLGNIDATSKNTTVPSNPATFNDINAAASFVAPLTVYDSIGGRRELSIAVSKTDAGKYNVTVYADGKDTGGTASKPVAIGSSEIQFDENGKITGNATVTANVNWSNGAAPGKIALDMAQFTQYATNSGLSGSAQNGKVVGNTQDYEVDKNGDVYAVLDSGNRQLLGSIAVASPSNPDGLERSGSSEYIATENAGNLNIGKASSGNRGAIDGGSLERSTVDISDEFVNLILYQRGYQANSQSLNAANDLLKETIQLMR